MKLLYDRVAVKRAATETKTAGGIIIPDSSQEKPTEGVVIAVGSGIRTKIGESIPLEVKVGDKVLFGKWNGSEVKIDGEEVIIMKESDIFVILD